MVFFIFFCCSTKEENKIEGNDIPIETHFEQNEKSEKKKRINIKPHGFVNDFEELFSESERSQMENKLNFLKETDSVEFAVVTIPRMLLDREFQEYSSDLFYEWGVGYPRLNNGILLSLSTSEKRTWVATGEYFNQDQFNQQLQLIVDSVMNPNFKRKKYGLGVSQGIDSIINLIHEWEAKEKKEEKGSI